MGKYLEERKPFTKKELVKYLNDDIEESYQFNIKYDYGNNARRFRERDIKRAEDIVKRFDRGEKVAVKTVSYREMCGNGLCDFSETLYSDGTVEESFYGWSD